MIAAIAIVALQLSQVAPATGAEPQVYQVQYGVPVRPPPCGHGWDVSARDGMCYPNGYLPPQEQSARQYQYRGHGYGGGYRRHPVPCGHGADLDVRDGRCYPTGTVPPQFQQGRQRYYGDDYHDRRPRRSYYREY